MLLDVVQQEQYSRHLLLDGFGGEGQERLLLAAVQVRGSGTAALWCARYLAASGVGRLAVDDPSWHGELLALGPWLLLVPHAAQQVSPREGQGPAGSAMNGAQAALVTVRAIVRGPAA